MQSTPPPNTSAPTGSPTPITPDSSDTFANDPLLNLLRLSKLKPVMTDDERRKHVQELRTLRTSPNALGRMLRQQKSAEDAKPAVEKVKDTKTAARDLYKELGL